MSPNALVSVPCPKCGKIYRIYQTNLGRTGICKKCKCNFRMVPKATKKMAKKPLKKIPPVLRSSPPEQSNSKVKQVIDKQKNTGNENQETKTSMEKEIKQVPVKTEKKEEVSANQKKDETNQNTSFEAKTSDSRIIKGTENLSKKNMEVLSSQIKTIVSDGMKAYLVEKSKMDSDVNIADIKKILAREKIIFGIVSDKKIQSFIDKRLKRIKPFLIAEGKLPTEPSHGSIEYMFDTNPIKNIDTSKVDEEQDRIDYKERGEMPFISKGDLIAQRIPGIPGKHGKDVFGKRIEAQKARQANLRCGNGVSLSEDKRMAHARIDGMPVLTTGRMERVNVLPQYYINGDVNMKTGNIRFAGPVVVKGTVQNGFKIRSASLEAQELYRADVRVDGNINIQGGVVGSKVVCLGEFKTKFLKGSTVECESDVVVKNGIVDSKVDTRTNCIVENNKILTSNIMALKDIITVDLGSKTSPGSQLTVGIDPVLAKEMARLKDELKLLEEKIENEEEELDIDCFEDIEDEYKEVIKKIEKLEPALEEASKITSGLIKNYKDLKNKEQQKEKQNKSKKQEQLISTIKVFSAKIGPAKKELITLKKDQKDLQSKIEKIQNLRSEFDKTQSEIQLINKKIQTSDQKARVVVKGDVYPGSIINGIDSSLEIFEQKSSVKFEEISIYNENNMPERQIDIKPLEKSKSI